MNFRILTAALLMGFVSAYSQETYSTWAHYKEVTVNTTSAGANVAGGVGKFPLLVRLTSANADVFTQAAANGADIRFTKADGVTRLPHQRERWDAANQVAEFWVLADTVMGNASNTVRMYWGKGAAADSSNGGQVFTAANGFVSVWHMGDSSGVNPRPNAVSGGPSATPTNFPGGYGPKAGVIGLADSLRGGWYTTKDYLVVGSPTTGFSDFTVSGITFSVWVYSTSNLKDVPYFSAGNGTSNVIIIGQSGTGTGEKFRFNSGTAGNVGINGGANKIANESTKKTCYKIANEG